MSDIFWGGGRIVEIYFPGTPHCVYTVLRPKGLWCQKTPQKTLYFTVHSYDVYDVCII